MPRPNTATARAAISLISRAGQTSKAHHLSNAIKDQQYPYSFNVVISDQTLDCYNSEGLQLFRRFQTSGSDPDEFTISKALSISTSLNALDDGKQIHAFLVKKNVPMDVPATNSLINLYLKCASVGDAERLFNSMPQRDVYTWTVMVTGYALNGRVKEAMASFEEMPWRNTVSWNSMISAYQREGYDEMALEIFGRMRRESEAPNKLTFIAVLKACIGLQRLGEGMGVHCNVVKSAWIKNVLVQCTLMDMYIKCGDVLDACKAFDEISEHNVVSWSILLAGFTNNGRIVDAEGIFNKMPEKNLVSWNVMIAGYVQSGMQDRAFSLSVGLLKGGMKPNCFTLTSLLSGCSKPRYSLCGKLFHGYVMKVGLQSNTSVGNSMITMYGDQGNIGDARLVFDMMPRYDVVSWTAIVSAYISNNDVDEARHIFDTMPEKNLISWNTMMFGYLQNGKNIETNSLNRMRNISYSVDNALPFFYDMERSAIKPDHFSYNCALSVCARDEALEQARVIHCRALKRGFESDVGVGNALITAYGKCGSLREAEKIFDSMTNPDVISWNALLTGYSQNGQGNEVLRFYDEMRNSGVEPNHVTFITLLSACSYMGEVKKGQVYFDGMEKEHGISPNKEHYACMVDLLGRAGLLHKAEVVIEKMPIEPDATVWGALLGACKMYGDAVIGRRAADQIFRLEPDNSAAYIALAETFAAARMWEDVAKVRAIIKGKRLLKEPGCSWIDVRNQKHVFLSGDLCHLEKDCIHETLSSLYSNMRYLFNSELLPSGIV